MIPGLASLLIKRNGKVQGINQVQKKVYLSVTNPPSHNITLDSIPNAGNILIIGVVSDTTVSPLPPTGYTTVASAVDFSGTYMFWKVSNGTESTITIALSTNASCCISVLEYTGLTTLDVATSATGQGTATVGTGTTATTTAANELIVSLAGLSNGGTTPPTVTSWNNSMVSQLSGQSSGIGTPVNIDMAVKTVSATATFTATATLSVAGSADNSGIIATFK